ncbi:phage tail fiber protein [Klebsiella aerogenes]|uniref:phage tail fiber protein n=1 Tax=Klebsiella aerogenes TaxID=548 RepID=UPI002FF148FD
MATTPTQLPVPSETPRDLKFNAGKIDEFVTGDVHYYTDRFGKKHITMAGMHAEFDAQLASQEARFDAFIERSGYQVIGDYADGPLTITEYNQLIRYGNELWKLTAATDLPYTTAGTTDETWNATDSLHFVSVGDAALRQNLGSGEDGMGMALIALLKKGNLFDLLGEWTSPEAWGAIANDESKAHHNSYCFFLMFENLRESGGGVVQFKPRSVYHLDFVNFIPGNVTIHGNGAKLIFINPTSAYGRGGLIIGSSREFNYESAKDAYNSGTYPTSILNTSVVDPVQKQYLRDNQQFVKADTVSIDNLIIEAKFTSETSWGGFAINCVNAQNVNISNIYTIGWTESVNAGSDVPPNTPSCHNIKIQNLTVIRGDIVRTYYAGFFFANSTSCEISGAVLETPLTDGSGNGSFGATNFTEDCVIHDISVPSLGRTASSEGILINNSKGCLVENIRVGNAKSAVSTFYTDTSMNDAARPNIFDSITGVNCDQVLGVTGKYGIFSNVKTYNCNQELLFRNNNASNNIFKSKPQSITIGSSASNLKYWFLINNSIDGWRRVYTWLRPLDILCTPFSSLSSWNSNNSVKFNSGVSASFLYKIPDGFSAVSGFTVYGDFSSGAAAAAVDSVCTVDVISMSAVDGNQTPPAVLLTASVSAKSNGDGIWSLTSNAQSSEPGYLPLEGSSVGVDNTMYLRITYTNGVANNTLKEIGLRIYKV